MSGPEPVVIINPVSGPTRRGGGAERVAVATGTFARLGVRGIVRLTERPHHAFDLAQEAVRGGARLVVAWGGDGTINEVARALAFSPAALGIVPGGSGNGLSRSLGIPFDPSAALERALTSSERPLDAGELDGRLFVNIAGVGLDAHVAGSVTGRVHHRGLIPYLAATARDLLAFSPSVYAIETDAGTFETTALIVAIANSTQYGFGARIAPAARIDDGLLDLVVVQDLGLFGNVVRVPSVFLGRFDRRRGVSVTKVRHARIRSALRMMTHVDGEAERGGIEVFAQVRPAALRLRA